MTFLFLLKSVFIKSVFIKSVFYLISFKSKKVFQFYLLSKN